MPYHIPFFKKLIASRNEMIKRGYISLWGGKEIGVNSISSFIEQIGWRYMLFISTVMFIFLLFIWFIVEKWPDSTLWYMVMIIFVGSAFLFNAGAYFMSLFGWIRPYDSKVIEYLSIFIGAFALIGISDVEFEFMRAKKPEFEAHINKQSDNLRLIISRYIEENCPSTPEKSDLRSKDRKNQQKQYCEWITNMNVGNFSENSSTEWSAIMATEKEKSKSTKVVALTEFQEISSKIRKSQIGLEKSKTREADDDKFFHQIFGYLILAVALALRSTKTTIDLFKFDALSARYRQRWTSK